MCSLFWIKARSVPNSYEVLISGFKFEFARPEGLYSCVADPQSPAFPNTLFKRYGPVSLPTCAHPALSLTKETWLPISNILFNKKLPDTDG